MPDGSVQPAHSLGIHATQCWIEDVENGFIFEGTSGFVVDSTNILVRKGGVGIRVDADSLFYNAVIASTQIRPFADPIRGIEFGVKNPHPRNRLSIADCQIVLGAPAVRLKRGAVRVNIHNNHLEAAGDNGAIVVDEGADLFTITNNVLTGKEPIRDASGPKARKTVAGNVEEKP
jgi:hypothetical protein